jgi:hypothetical protein
MKGEWKGLIKPVWRAAFLLLAVAPSATLWSQSNYIAGVPDIVMPPALPPWLQNGNNWCAPTAAANVVKYWDSNGYVGVAGGFANRNLAGEMGWFMDTNDQTVPDDLHLGSWLTDPMASGFDIVNGVFNWARWDANNSTFGVNNLPYPGQTPAAKIAYPWSVTLVQANLFANAVVEIDAGRPLLAAFQHWDMVNTGLVVQVGGNQIQVWDFNPQPQGAIGGSNEDGFWEQDFALGHMVTGIGYVQNFLYKGNMVNLLIVHDGIGANGLGFVTPVDMAVVVSGPQWIANVDVDPVPEPATLLGLSAGLALWIARRKR